MKSLLASTDISCEEHCARQPGLAAVMGCRRSAVLGRAVAGRHLPVAGGQPSRTRLPILPGTTDAAAHRGIS